MFEICVALEREYEDLEQQMSDPALHADPAAARRVGKRHAQLRPVVAAYRQWLQLGEDEAAARELAAEDADFAAEADALGARARARRRAADPAAGPRDPMDDKDVILEVKAGEGGEESALFAADLLRMYLRYAERRGWRTEILDAEESDLGGYKDVQVAVKARGTVEPGDAPYARLKFEGGVHRVQRVPVTESQGRIHTSAAGVLVLPEAEEVDVQIDPNDLRIDIYRSSGPGGQSVNTTDSAVRITHVPTGDRRQLPEREEPAAEQGVGDARAARPACWPPPRRRPTPRPRTCAGPRCARSTASERVRTYNFPENRIADHRVNYKSHNLDAVLDGELDDVIDALTDADMAVRLAAS